MRLDSEIRTVDGEPLRDGMRVYAWLRLPSGHECACWIVERRVIAWIGSEPIWHMRPDVAGHENVPAAPIPDSVMLYAGEPAYRASQQRYHEARAAERAAREVRQAARAKRARHAAVIAGDLYGQAMALAADYDDMDVVEHYCQGNIARLREFIAARSNGGENTP